MAGAKPVVPTVMTGFPVSRCPNTSLRALSATTAYQVRGLSVASSDHWSLVSAVSRTVNRVSGLIATWRSSSAPRTGVFKRTVIGPVGHEVRSQPQLPRTNRKSPWVANDHRCSSVRPRSSRDAGTTTLPLQPGGRGCSGTRVTTRRRRSADRSRSHPPASRNSQRSLSATARTLSTRRRTGPGAGHSLSSST